MDALTMPDTNMITRDAVSVVELPRTPSAVIRDTTTVASPGATTDDACDVLGASAALTATISKPSPLRSGAAMLASAAASPLARAPASDAHAPDSADGGATVPHRALAVPTPMRLVFADDTAAVAAVSAADEALLAAALACDVDGMRQAVASGASTAARSLVRVGGGRGRLRGIAT